ncbi:MAG: adenosine deaminase, partial [Gammaproteobacteria bacterium]|nr:adenosine deaminase [Gammaproteobacteria bacterium]
MKLTRSWTMATLMLFSACGNGVILAAELDARLHFQQVRHDPALLRGFLYAFPKGGELHNHLDGAIYAESYIRWGAEDGKCIDLENYAVTLPPCDAPAGRPALSEVQFDGNVVNRIIDAFSIRNYERRPVSGHNQFFSTFGRFYPAGFGREGYMLAESSARSARQNMVYLELLQSWGMAAARQLAADGDEFNPERPLAELVRHPGIEQLAVETITRLDAIEQQWRNALACGQEHADPGCGVTVRYLAQVIRTFPRSQVLAQTLLAYHLIEKDPRYVGLNFVAPEDDPIT